MRRLTSSTWGPEEREAILRVVDSGRVTMDAETLLYERAYADYCGSKYCVAVNSGSSANLLMAAAWTLRYGPGVVIVPAVGWATSYSPFHQYGWTMRFVDVNPSTLSYDREALHAASDYADLILAINLLGSPCEYGEFPNLPVLEDNCESMGAVYMGKRTGTFGVMASHSTYFSHHICTMEGGMVTTDDEHFYHMLLSLRSHGWTRHLPPDNHLGAEVAPWNFILPGYNVRPTDMQSAIGLTQLKKLPAFIEQRRDNADRFPWMKQKEVGISSWYGFVVYDEDREKVIGKHEHRPVISGNFLRQPVCKQYRIEAKDPKDYPGAERLHHHAVMIGNSHERIEW